MESVPQTRALVSTPASSQEGAITDEEFLNSVLSPDEPRRVVMEEAIRELYLTQETSDVPEWFLEFIRSLRCRHGREELRVSYWNYLQDGGARHIALARCPKGDISPVMGFVALRPEKPKLEIDQAIELWREAYESQIACPYCDSNRMGESRLKRLEAKGRAVVSTICLKCRSTSLVVLNWIYQDPLRQGPPPTIEEFLSVRDVLWKTISLPREFAQYVAAFGSEK